MPETDAYATDAGGPTDLCELCHGDGDVAHPLPGYGNVLCPHCHGGGGAQGFAPGERPARTMWEARWRFQEAFAALIREMMDGLADALAIALQPSVLKWAALFFSAAFVAASWWMLAHGR